MKVRIVIYDDLTILDETEMITSNKEQMVAVASNMLKQNADSETAEIWDKEKEKLITKLAISRKGKITPVKTTHPNWGGKRAGAGPKTVYKDVIMVNLSLRIRPAVDEYLSNITECSKSDFIRKAIDEAIERRENGKS